MFWFTRTYKLTEAIFLRKAINIKPRHCALRTYAHFILYSTIRIDLPHVHCFHVDNGALMDVYCFHFIYFIFPYIEDIGGKSYSYLALQF